MATWNFGPFDNDDAVEWCDRLQSTDPVRRGDLVEMTLSEAVAHPAEVTAASSSEIIAAAAAVLQAATGAPIPTTPYATVFPTGTEGIEPTPRLIAIARTALEVIVTEGSAFRRQWAGDVEEDLALENVERLHHGLVSA